MDGTDQGALHQGRMFVVTVEGANASGLELAALDEARAFFGPDLQLRVKPDYAVMRRSPGGPYWASVIVLVVEPPGDLSPG